MKKITLLLSFIACVAFTQAQTLLVENFDYNVGTELTANGWSVTGAAATPNILVTSSTITYSGYQDSGVGNEVTLGNTGQDVNKAFAPQTSGNVYVSFIANITSATAAGDYFLNVGAASIATAFYGRVFVKKSADNDKIAFGIQYTSSGTVTQTYSELIYDLNTTYLIVLKYVIDGENSNTSIIVNPAIGTTEPTSGWLANNTGTQAKPANIGSVALRQGSATTAPTLKLDGIRVATSWAALFTTSNVSNPSSDKFRATVVGNDLQIKNVANGATVEIFSALGSKVQTSVLENGKVSVDNLSKGMYIVRVGKNTQKFML